jgi:hypothetical protein
VNHIFELKKNELSKLPLPQDLVMARPRPGTRSQVQNEKKKSEPNPNQNRRRRRWEWAGRAQPRTWAWTTTMSLPQRATAGVTCHPRAQAAAAVHIAVRGQAGPPPERALVPAALAAAALLHPQTSLLVSAYTGLVRVCN